MYFWVGGVPNFQKDGGGGGGLDRISIFGEGLRGKRKMTFFRGACSFYIKNRLKSEIFNDKNWEILVV